MTDIEIRKLGALEIGSAIKEGKITSYQATKAFLDAIEKTDGEYKTYITVIRDEALERPKRLTKPSRRERLRALLQVFRSR